jgi:hypothetical protein
MPARALQAVFCMGLMAIGASAVEQSDLVHVKITVLDVNGRSIDDLQQGDFVLTVDGIEVILTRWTRSQDLFSHATYTLVFRAAHSIPPSRHSIEVRLKRQSARLRYPPSLDY